MEMITAMAFFWASLPLVICILLLGYRAFKHKEMMALIKAGKELPARRSSVDKSIVLLWACVLIGNAIGLLIGVIISITVKMRSPLAFLTGIGAMAISTGIALLICFNYLKKSYEK